jgi:hypothetical protein
MSLTQNPPFRQSHTAVVLLSSASHSLTFTVPKYFDLPPNIGSLPYVLIGYMSRTGV